jgi:N6-adenosine-specific RNA methylase IME4
VVYADPPWQYQDRNCNGSAEQHYRTMPLDEIKALPVGGIAAPDAVLLLWATWPLLREAMELIEAWGFTYKTIGFNWIKRNRSDCGFFFGLGRWTRGNAEPCLLATRGKPKRVNNAVSQLIFEPVGRHSAKPPVVRDRIVTLLGDVPRIELFARERVDGWEAWGNEVEANAPREVRRDAVTSTGLLAVSESGDK